MLYSPLFIQFCSPFSCQNTLQLLLDPNCRINQHFNEFSLRRPRGSFVPLWSEEHISYSEHHRCAPCGLIGSLVPEWRDKYIFSGALTSERTAILILALNCGYLLENLRLWRVKILRVPQFTAKLGALGLILSYFSSSDFSEVAAFLGLLNR